jgi:3-dehydroquinate synthase
LTDYWLILHKSFSIPFVSLMSQISIQNNPSELLTPFFVNSQYSAVAVLTDANTYTYCYRLIQSLLPPHSIITIAAGEEHKNLESCKRVWEKLTDLHADRHSLLVVLGGGVLGDLGGFCAATFKRGIDFVLMPTTLLAQVDASVGGKLGIDFNQFKNHIGVFCEPVATLICPTFLNTLPERELRSGFAEIIKHCLISDKAMWDVVRAKSLSDQDWATLIPHSVTFKKSVIDKDPREKGLRKILNFGHTVGHAVESYSLNSGDRLFHGEAIAVGMIAEASIAEAKKMITRNELSEISRFVKLIYPKVILPSSFDEIIKLTAQDKKNKGNKILMALTLGIGQARWDVEVSPGEIEASLNYYQQVYT